MNAMIEDLERQRDRLQSQFAELGDLRPGSLVARYRKCGSPGCHCAQEGDPGYGPSWHLIRAVKGKTRTRVIPAHAAGHTRALVAEYQRFRQLSKIHCDCARGTGGRMAASDTAFSVALGGLIALAVGIGVGRFVYTPILPFMTTELGLTPAEGGLVASANFLGHLLGALAAVRARMPGGRRAWLLGCLALSAATTAAMGVTTAMAGFVVLRFAGGVASALAIVLSTAIVLDRLAVCGRRGLSWMPYAGVGAGIALSAALVAGLGAHGADWSTLWLASGALSVMGLLACVYLIAETPGAASEPGPPGGQSAGRGLPAFVVAYGLFGFGYVITATFISQQVRTTPEIAALESVVWLIVGVAAIPSVAIWVWLDERYGNCTAFALACLVESLGVGASALETSTAAVLFAAVGLGGTVMGLVALGLIIARRMIGGDPRRIAAVMTASFGLGQMVGPMYAGYAYGLGGSFQIPTLTAAAALLVAAALTFRLRT